MTGIRPGGRARILLAATLTAGLALGLTACGGSGSGTKASADGKVTISVGCEPPTSKPVSRDGWVDDVKAFEKQNPKVTVVSDDTNPCDDPATFNAKLASGKMDDVFYTYFTDADNVIDSGQAADIQKYTGDINEVSSIQSSLMNVYRQGNQSTGDLYGVPTGNYSLGMVYNKALFKRAGLDPNKPPTTWDQVETDAIAINKLGGGVVGYGDYSAGNTGGWHFAAEMYSRGGTMVSADGKTASFDNAQGLATLQFLHKLRFTDNVMGTKQGLQYNDLLQMMASGKLGMYVGSPDNLTAIHTQYKTAYTNLGVGPMPGVSKPTAALVGGSGYMFNKNDSPAQIEAGIKFVNYEFMTSGIGQFNYKRLAATKQPVGLPEPDLWSGAAAVADTSVMKKYANIPTDNFASYVASTPTMHLIIEPPQAQAIYAQGDKAMDSILTNPNANAQQLLDTFKTATNTVLANAQH
ncbi:extracellular solute-binding protein [Streptomyces sp. SL13]|jgi:multiple sugar transport system substrate-binding protein|uniref:Extracellular solute-binding protein n=1 Tax=Streptantibioticus silvisoli TaxID=2705255 RepID=A0AA90H1F9_9ACTN|nr:extracellular solute-binding protein [Streptantibioticus silvisoli]MDI5963731.1 extracellular solute-binding protein [Streptantibioticus silvisoli]MDI5969571.1 extracellular solute-binding protein [Streptantibioticus silvisoli]